MSVVRLFLVIQNPDMSESRIEKETTDGHVYAGAATFVRRKRYALRVEGGIAGCAMFKFLWTSYPPCVEIYGLPKVGGRS